MTDTEILILWDEVNHNQSVTQQLLDFARLVEEETATKKIPSLVDKLLAELESETE